MTDILDTVKAHLSKPDYLALQPDDRDAIRALVAEVERLRMDIAHADDAVRSALDTARAAHDEELATLRQRIADMDGQHLCAYCSLVIPGASWDALRAHIDVCPKHPLAELRQQHAEAVEAAYREGFNEDLMGSPDPLETDDAWNKSKAKARLT